MKITKIVEELGRGESVKVTHFKCTNFELGVIQDLCNEFLLEEDDPEYMDYLENFARALNSFYNSLLICTRDDNGHSLDYYEGDGFYIENVIGINEDERSTKYVKNRF